MALLNCYEKDLRLGFSVLFCFVNLSIASKTTRCRTLVMWYQKEESFWKIGMLRNLYNIDNATARLDKSPQCIFGQACWLTVLPKAAGAEIVKKRPANTAQMSTMPDREIGIRGLFHALVPASAQIAITDLFMGRMKMLTIFRKDIIRCEIAAPRKPIIVVFPLDHMIVNAGGGEFRMAGVKDHAKSCGMKMMVCLRTPLACHAFGGLGKTSPIVRDHKAGLFKQPRML